jgi:small subunit ribosomal protein S3Ae
MAIGKNPRLNKGKKGGKKKQIDPFTRKDWYLVKAPALFSNRFCGRTLINRTFGTRVASEEIKGRVFDINLADLNGDEEQGYRKIKLIVEDVRGDQCLTNFHGMDMTRDKLCSLIHKWQTLIEANATVRTTDGYELRMFCIAFTRQQKGQVRKTSYAQMSQIREIRRRMVDTMTEEASHCTLRELVQKLTTLPESISLTIEKACQGVYPLQNVFIRKVKIKKRPRFDVTRLLEMHGEGKKAEDLGAPIKTTSFKLDQGNSSLEGSGGRL